ncbi:MAG: DNRLRE domain-containing protein [Anaerolineae bacterium]|nr:DNRLRE domain-containing protein [Anaerolineae bacterium]
MGLSHPHPRVTAAPRWMLCVLVTALLVWGFCAGLWWRPPAQRALATADTVTITLAPTALAGIAEGSPTQSFAPAADGAMTIGWSYRASVGRRAGLLWFDLGGLPAGVMPLKAVVKADIAEHSGLATMVTHLSRLRAGWQAGRPTWKNRPPALPGQAQAVLGTAGTAAWDITPWVADWLAHPEENHGLLVDSFADFPEANERTLAGWRLELTLPADELALHVETDPSAVSPGGTLVYRIRIENAGTTTADALHLTAELPAQARFLSCSDGCAPHGSSYSWDLPALEPGRSQTVLLTVSAAASARAGEVLHLRLRLSSFASPSSTTLTVQTPLVPPAGTPAPTPGPTSTPGPCTERVTNGGFEEFTAGWTLAGDAPPFVMPTERHSGFFSLLLGGLGMEQSPTESIAWQRVRIPSDAVRARLSFWYLLSRPASEEGYDWFTLEATDAAGRILEQISPAPRSGWAEAGLDLSAYRGQILYLRFRVHNDGNAGATRAYLDDVSLCVERPAGPEPAPTPYPGLCSPRGDAPDYAPAGLPDFSARQEDWAIWYPAEVWAYDGPAALADVLWWLDSRLEGADQPPPAVADSFPLVTAYGAWDDHDPRNAVPFIVDLAGSMDTNGLHSGDGHLGTRPEDMLDALQKYLQERGLAGSFEVEWITAPGFEDVRAEVRTGAGVVLLLGFWQWDAYTGEWSRVGGRYLGAAGVLCEEDALLVSDPLRDGREAGFAGEALPVEDHPHAAEQPEALHNDAAFVSHDLYHILLQPAGWGLAGYVDYIPDIAVSLGANPAVGQPQASLASNAVVTTRVEGALVVRPAPSTAAQAFPTPAPRSAQETASLTVAFDTQGPPTLWPRPLLVTMAGGPALPVEALASAQTDVAGQALLPLQVRPGAWELTAFVPGSLALMTPLRLQPGGNRWDAGVPVWGDINADQRIGADDLSRLIAAWGSRSGEPAFDPPADLDRDGEVGQGDWDLLVPNLGRGGPAAALPGSFLVLRWTPASAAGGDWLALSLLPSDTKTIAGDIVPVTLQAIAFGSSPDVVAVHLDYDPNVLQIVDGAGAPAECIQPVEGMDTVLVNRVDNYAGRVDFIAAQRGAGGGESLMDLARFHLRARAPAREAWLRFSTAGSRRSTAAAGGQALGISFSALRAEISGGRVTLPLLCRR